MDHLAILKAEWGFDEKILNGEKTIESRWYKTKRAPWDRMRSGEYIYFKNSGGDVSFRAEVEKVIQFEKLTPERISEILKNNYKSLGIEKEDIQDFFERSKDKRYCILIYLKNPIKIEPFSIDKTGYGNMSAWICTDDIRKIRK